MKRVLRSAGVWGAAVAVAIAAAVPSRAADVGSARLVNIATRVAVGGAAGTPIPGFVLGGAGGKTVVVRAVGPTLAGFGVAGVLADPQFSLVRGDATLLANDNWNARDGAAMTAAGAFALGAGSRDAAVVTGLAGGAYSAPVTAADGGSGVALVEIYDGDARTDVTLVNASTRAFVGDGDSVLIPGFVVAGTGTLRLLIRAVGPTLGTFGVGGVLADPTLTLFRGPVALATNDNWSGTANAVEIGAAAQAVGAFALPTGSRDAALLVALAPGSYSAVVSGVGGTTGTALVELYVVPEPAGPAGLAVTAVAAAPAAPNYADKVFVTARAQPEPGGRIAQLRLGHVVGAQPAAGGETQPMFDDGRHGDGAASDGVWGAAIPAQAAGTAVSYTVTAVSESGSSVTSPAATYVVASTLWDVRVSDVNAPLGFSAPEFLGIPTDRGVTLNLEANQPVELYVEYGDASGAYVGRTPPATYPAGAPIDVRIEAPSGQTPLLPNQRVFYRVRYRAPGEPEFRARGERSFTTARPRGQAFTFTITADPHLDEVTSPALFTLAMRNIAADNPDFNVDLGDIFMSDKMATILPGLAVNYGLIEFRALTLRNHFAEFCHSVPFFFTLGNHEAEYRYVYDADRTTAKNSNLASWNLLARKAYFPTPVPGPFYTGSTETRTIEGRSEQLENYYAWEWGDALFVVLDPFNNTLTNPNANPADNWRWSLGKAQYDWLKATLQGSRARYKFVFLHHLVGGFASARGGIEAAQLYEWGGRTADGVDEFAARRPGWEQPIHALFVATKVSAVFHGHDHFYGYQVLDGIVYQECPQPGTANFSTGSARDGGYTNGTILPNSGHLRVSVASDGATVQYVRAALPNQETATLRNRTIAHTYRIAPAN
ncbi:MAG: metallophosphoesterase [Opitutaceae bacterium]|nr:metallophosphoesterase [Opitutaceae bacterium]